VSGFSDRLRAALRVTCTVGIVQAVLESVAISVVYAGVILPPSDFFNIRLYDGFARLYRGLTALAPDLYQPGLFVGRGMAAKLSMLPDLMLINVAMALLLAPVVAVLAPYLRMRRADGRLSAERVLYGVMLTEVAFYAFAWWHGLHIPKDPTAWQLAKNAARNFVYDGTLLAVCVAAVTTIVARGWLGIVAAGWGRRASLLGLGIVCVLGLVAATGRAASSRPTLEPPTSGSGPVAKGYNVILISIDTLRADHVGAYGYARATSPTIDALASSGVMFRHTTSTTSWTLPAHLSMLTGRSLLGHGVVDDDHMLGDDVPTLAESFQRAGYATGAIVSAPYLESRYGFARGFDDYDDHTIQWSTHGESYKHVTAPLVQKTAETWLEQHAKGRFFLFLHYWDPHYDYAPGPPYDTMFDPDYRGDLTGDNYYFNPRVNRKMNRRDLEHIIALYDGEIRLVDDHLAMLRGTLERLGVTARTVIVVTGDHGEEFFEHGYKGHQRSLYEESVRVPLVVNVPGVTPARRVVETETSLIDVMPTILALTGLPIPAGVEGVEMADIAFAGAPEHERHTVSELYRTDALNVQVSVRDGAHKLIQHMNRPRMESYDLSLDPAEAVKTPGSAPWVGPLSSELLGWLNQRWPGFQKRVGLRHGTALTMDAETEERLRALGYVQ